MLIHQPPLSLGFCKMAFQDQLPFDLSEQELDMVLLAWVAPRDSQYP